MKRALVMTALPVLLGLGACTEKPQEMHSNPNYAPEFKGTGSAFVVPGWTPGDKTSWEQELKARAQRGQNEYNKTNN
jgi:hypothetical protein